MIIYGSTLSPFVRKAVAALGEKELEFELQPTGFPNPTPEFREASPLGKMPALRDGSFTLSDSSAIIHYVDARYPETPLIPADPELRGKAVYFDEFGDTVLVTCGVKLFFNRIVAPRFLGRDGDLAAAAEAEANELPPILDYIEKVAPDPGGFLVGGGITIADLSVASPFANLRHCVADLDESRWPRAFAYADSILSRPSIAPFVKREQEILAA
jgi:glutathione S-transferase